MFKLWMSCAFSVLKPLNPREDAICRFLPIILLWLKRLSVPSNNACPTYGWPGDMIKRESLSTWVFLVLIFKCTNIAWNQDKQMQKADWFEAKGGWRTKNKVSRQPTDPYSKPNIGKPAQWSLACKCYSILKKNLCRNSAHLIIVKPEQFLWFCTDNQCGDGRANGDFKTSLEDWINGLVIHSVEKHRPHFTVFIYAPQRSDTRLSEQYLTTGVAQGDKQECATHNGTTNHSRV